MGWCQMFGFGYKKRYEDAMAGYEDAMADLSRSVKECNIHKQERDRYKELYENKCNKVEHLFNRLEGYEKVIDANEAEIERLKTLPAKVHERTARETSSYKREIGQYELLVKTLKLELEDQSELKRMRSGMPFLSKVYTNEKRTESKIIKMVATFHEVNLFQEVIE